MATMDAKRQSSAAPVRDTLVSGLRGAWWKLGIVGAGMCYVIYGAFFIANGVASFGQSGNPARIVFFHVPVAILSYVAYAVGAGYGISYLRNRRLDHDVLSAASMELGFVFCILATITGSIFAGVQWGAYWNWDPRETSIAVMLLLYASYLLLRGALGEKAGHQRARLSAVYVLVALVPATFLIWVVPRLPWLQSLHPTTTLIKPENTSLSYKLVLYPSFAAFIMMYVWMLQLRARQVKLMIRREANSN